ncbi:MAG TPA: glycosyltransferase family 4 protein [Tepidisphaeraceae bacterium]|jgi:glycosyltransferase involved in cell wall biosynthesis|nr:glycosyltransferase family 4 protein [Tepidisphaeraceae bacterium]
MIHYITTTGIGNAWVGNELHIVSQHGVPFVLHSMRGPQQAFFRSPWAAELQKNTRILYPLPIAGAALSILLAPIFFGGKFFSALFNALFGRRESLRARIAALSHFFVACHWARSLRHEKVSLIHAQWVHSSGSIGMYGARLLGAPFSFTGHASDLFRDRVALEDKIRRADFIVCISEFHRDFYKKLGARDDQLHIVYCGIELDKFAPSSSPRIADGTLCILSSGRLVAKKGFKDLIAACRIIADRGIDLECIIAGSGPLQQQLQWQIDELKLTDRVRLTGQEIKQEDIPSFMHTGDIYCLPCVWSDDGDVDGLPQMLMEAMACGLPGISTRLVGIPDLVIHEKTGLLVEPGNVQQIADAIIRLHNNPAEARQFAANARQWIIEKFDLANSLDPLIALFRGKLASNHEPSRANCCPTQTIAAGARE